MTPTDQQLLERIRERDEAAFDLLVARYREPLRRHLAGVVCDTNAAADLLQEVWLRVWTRAEQWDNRGTVKAWLFRIATNLASNYLRSCRRRRERPLERETEPGEEGEDLAAWLMDAASLGPEERLEQTERNARLAQLVEELPEEKRLVLRLVYEAEMDTRAVAEALEIPEGTVRSRLYYARQQLARHWEAFEQEGDI